MAEMRADDQLLIQVFASGGDLRFVLPIFQREYAWEESNWQTLLDDIMAIYNASSKHDPEHFLGTLVVH